MQVPPNIIRRSLIVRLACLCGWLLLCEAPNLRGATNVLVPAGSVWKYLDDGSDQGTAWRMPAFNDSNWPAGPAQLGYGETDQRTELSFGTNATSKHITYYFRTAFAVSGASNYSSVTIRLLRDDGAVVFLNGTNVFRSNMGTGTIGYRTFAASNVTGSSETNFFATNGPAGVLREGTNVLAVEVHQFSASSADLSFDLELLGTIPPPPTNTVEITRGPYLQQGSATNVIVRWRTDIAASSRVRFGSAADQLNRSAQDSDVTTEHEVRLTGLEPDTKYFYSIGTTNQTLAGDGSHFFVTAPTNARPTRIWVIGDSGTADERPRSVYQAYTNFTGARHTDLWLMLGDNAYNTGTDAQYQAAVFRMYPELLRTTVVWPTIGNHDTAFDTTPAPTIPYFRIFSLPVNGEAGGVPSGTEHYYSYNYANIHFVCLDAMASDRSADGPMCAWLREDLAAHDQDWLIAYWHHPPYTKGSHDSDVESELIEMRQNVVPILEAFGTDLVLCGHSHCYERSFLINGHYGRSGTFDDAMKRDGGSGREDETGSYLKPGTGTNSAEGTVYVVAGSSGQATFLQGDGPHSAMFITELELGSLVLDIDGPVLRAKFLRETGVIDDYFTIIKGTAPSILRIVSHRLEGNTLTLTWNTHPGQRYRVEHTAELVPPVWTSASAAAVATGVTMSWSTHLSTDQPRGFYRVVDEGN